MSKLISVNYWLGCDWCFYEVGYLGLHAGQLSLACAVVYLWNTGYLRVTCQRMNSRIQQAAPDGNTGVEDTDGQDDQVTESECFCQAEELGRE